MCFVFIFTHILDWQTLLMLLFSAAVKVSIIILLFLHFFSLKKNDINAISPSHFPSIPPSFRLHHRHHAAINPAIISPPSPSHLHNHFAFITNPIPPSSSSSCRHHSASIIVILPPLFRLHHHPCRHHFASIIIIMPPSFRLHHHPFLHHFTSIIIIMPPSIPPSFRLHHHDAIIS